MLSGISKKKESRTKISSKRPGKENGILKDNEEEELKKIERELGVFLYISYI